MSRMDQQNIWSGSRQHVAFEDLRVGADLQVNSKTVATNVKPGKNPCKEARA